jgi:hypothetical protein
MVLHRPSSKCDTIFNFEIATIHSASTPLIIINYNKLSIEKLFMFLNIIVVASKSVYWSVSTKSLNKMVLLLNDLSKLLV